MMTIWTAIKLGVVCPACLRHWFDNDHTIRALLAGEFHDMKC
jgi:hypothetical protein